MRRLDHETVEQLVKERGMKMTAQRLAIIDYLQQAENHPTPEEVIKAVNEEHPQTSRATVYNTIRMLKEAGLLTEIFEGGVARLDPNYDRHHHFVCRKCGMVEDVGFDLIADLGICSLPNHHKIEGFEIVIRGLCGKCR